MDRYVVSAATAEDVPAFTSCIVSAFTNQTGVRAAFANYILPPNEATHSWFNANLWGELKRDKSPVMLKVVDTQEQNRIIGIAKMQKPKSGASFSAPYPENAGLDVPYMQRFFGSKAVARNRLMGERPYFYLEIVGVVSEKQGKGIGRMLMEKCCEIIEQDGSEAYLESSTAGQKLYERFGFVEQEIYLNPEPWQEITNALMIRPGKAGTA